MQTATAQTTTTYKMPVLRGIRTHEMLLFEDNTPPPAPKTFNGRDPQKIEARDNFLLHRFYFKSRIKRMLYGDTLKELAAETWLSELQVQKIIQDKTELVMDIKKAAPTVKQLKQLFAHIVWE